MIQQNFAENVAFFSKLGIYFVSYDYLEFLN